MKAKELKRGDVFVCPDTAKPLEVKRVERYGTSDTLVTVYSTDGNEDFDGLMLCDEKIVVIGLGERLMT